MNLHQIEEDERIRKRLTDIEIRISSTVEEKDVANRKLNEF
jgi:hypothetical protein